MKLFSRVCVGAAVCLCACRGQGCSDRRDNERVAAAMSPRTIDCPPGLARCEGGSISISKEGTIAENCTSPETCLCPWLQIGSCERACVADDVTVIATEAVALVQLCDANARVASSPHAASIACSGPGWICGDGNLYRCGDDDERANAEAFCERGCAKVSGVDDILPKPVAAKLLCAR